MEALCFLGSGEGCGHTFPCLTFWFEGSSLQVCRDIYDTTRMLTCFPFGQKSGLGKYGVASFSDALGTSDKTLQV